MKNNLINKTVAVTLSVVLLASEVGASELSSLFGTAKTKASSWTSPATGEKFFYSGSYQFTFNGGNSYAPWFNASQVGGITVGCGGISIKNMFMSMIGLDKIKDQLSSSGSSVGWGTMLALISGMPILDKTFARIRKWGRTIQALLQNACNFGKMLGNKAFSEPIKNFTQDMIGKGTYLDVVDSGGDLLLGKVEDLFDGLNLANNLCTDDGTPASAKCKEVLGKTSSASIPNQNSLKVTSVISAAAGNLSPDSIKDSQDIINIDLLSNFLKDGKIADTAVISNADKLKFTKNTIIMARLFFGDFVYSKDSVEMILEDTECNGPSANAVCRLSADKIKAKLKSQGIAGAKSKKTPTQAYVAPIFSAKIAADVFLNGVNEKSCKNGCSKGSVKIHDSYILFGTKTLSTSSVNVADVGATAADAATTTNQTGTVKEAAIILGSTLPIGSTPAELIIEWDGATVESLKQIKYDIKSKNGIDVNYGYLEGEPTQVNGDNNGTIPIVIPSYGKIVDTIAKIEKARKRETAFTASLKELVAKYNAYLYSKSLVGYMNGFVLSSLQSTGNGDKRADLQTMIDNIKTVTKSIQEELDDSVGDIEKFNTIMETFEKIDKEFRTELNNNMQ